MAQSLFWGLFCEKTPQKPKHTEFLPHQNTFKVTPQIITMYFFFKESELD